MHDLQTLSTATWTTFDAPQSGMAARADRRWSLSAGQVSAWIEIGPRLGVGGSVTDVGHDALHISTTADTLLDLVDGRELSIRFAGLGGTTAKARARVVVRSSDDRVAFAEMDLTLRDSAKRMATVQALIGAALLKEPDGPDSSALRDAGFPARIPAMSLEYRLASCDADLEAIVALRTRAYIAAGKRSSDAPRMSDRYDEHALHLAAWIGSRPVAAIRLLPWRQSVGFEHDALLGWPAPLPPREESMEVMRACVDPYVRVSGASLGIFQRAAALVLQRRARYLVSCATTCEHLRLYVKLGGQDTGLRYAPPELGGVEHGVFVTDLRRAFLGVGVPLTSYAVVWHALGQRLQGAGLASPICSSDARRAHLTNVLSPALRGAALALPRRFRRSAV